MLNILGRRNSSNVQKVLWACDELHLPYEREDIGGAFGHNHSAKYLAMNPNGTIPTLIDNGRTLWESNAIVRYLCESRESHGLLSKDVWSIALAQQWMDWQQTKIMLGLGPLFLGLVRTAPEQRDADALENAEREVEAGMRLLDNHLADRTFVMGEKFSIADIPLGCACYRWYALDIKYPDLANLRAWYDRLKIRPGFIDHVMMPLT